MLCSIKFNKVDENPCWILRPFQYVFKNFNILLNHRWYMLLFCYEKMRNSDNRIYEYAHSFFVQNFQSNALPWLISILTWFMLTIHELCNASYKTKYIRSCSMVISTTVKLYLNFISALLDIKFVSVL